MSLEKNVYFAALGWNALKILIKSILSRPGCVAQLVGALFLAPNDCPFDFRSGHIPGLQVWPLAVACMGGNQSLSQINGYIPLCED